MAGPKSADVYAALRGYAVDPSEREFRRLFWRDDMENYTTCKWRPTAGTGTVQYVNAAVAPAPYNNIPAFEGDYILEVYDATIGLAGAQLRLALGRLSLEQKVSIEYRWLKQLNTPLCYEVGVEQNFGLPTVPSVLNAYIQYNFTTQYWRLRNAAGNLQNIVRDLGVSAGIWNYLKVVVDLQNRVYDRLITTELDVDLRAYAIGLQAWGAISGLYQPILYHQTTNPGDELYYDDFRVYLNEE